MENANAFFTVISDAFTQVITWLGEFLTALTSSGGALFPLLVLVGISVSVSLILLGIKITRSFSWGW